ncbi:MAG: hypothetical protein ACD_22C00106G0012 [uncultured bacterium]|nr:MAG: hypothetical protein ACD_22C00106G0012 [uncultured bacterium]
MSSLEHQPSNNPSPWRVDMDKFHQKMLAEWDTSTDASTFEYQKEGTDIERELDITRGKWLDIGGPSPSLDCFGVDPTSKRKLFSANIRLNPYSDSQLKADVLVDNCKTLPFASESVGAVFMNGFPPIKLKDISEEVHRVIEPGGMWYLFVAFGENIDYIEELGFEVIKISNVDDTEPGNKFKVLFTKLT